MRFPGRIAAVALIVVPPLLGSDRSIFRFVAGVTLLGFVCFLASVMLTDNTLRFVALAIGGPCIAVLNPCFWTFPSRYFSGKRAAASIAAINAIGNIGDFCAEPGAVGAATYRQRRRPDAGAGVLPRRAVRAIELALAARDAQVGT